MNGEKQEEAKIAAPKYSAEEQNYINARVVEMVMARNVRETPHDEFDGMTYIQRCEANRKDANTFIRPRRNKEDTNYVSGTVRQKINTYLSYLQNLSIEPEIHAFNDRNVEDVTIGSALTDISTKLTLMDNDDEKRLQRQYVLLEQGEVFVEEIWPEYYEVVKEMKKPFDGQTFDKNWSEREVKKANGPTRNILLNENVYLGDITCFDMDDQPFIFTVQQVPWEVAELEYGTWARWKHVPKHVKYLAQPIPSSLYNQNWSLTEVQKGSVEIVKYQCRTRNEFAIFVNGILMTPVGLPIPRKWGRDGESVRYNVTKQVLGIISPFFAYGKGIPATLKTKAYILDEMNRLAILKSQQSYQPPRWNMSGVVLSSRMFMPGKINNGLDGSKVGTLVDSNGMTKSELQMIQYLQKGMDDDVASNTSLNGQVIGAGRMSATQSRQMAQQADMMMTLSVFAATMLETKLGTLRLYNIMENFFDPIDTTLDDTKEKLINKYRSINVEKVIPGQGPGQSIVEVSENGTTPEELNKRVDKIKADTGKPTQLTVLHKDLMKTLAYSFFVTAVPKPKKNSDLTKVLFNEMFEKAKEFPNLNVDYMSERFAVVWGEDPTKMFKKGDQSAPADGAGADAPGKGNPAPTGKGARGKMINKNMMKVGGPKAPTASDMMNSQ